MTIHCLSSQLPDPSHDLHYEEEEGEGVKRTDTEGRDGKDLVVEMGRTDTGIEGTE